MQRVVVVTPPEPFIDLAEAKEHLRVDHDDDDDLISVLINAATGHIDGPDGWLGRAIGVQTLELMLPGFVAGSFALPCPPALFVEGVQYEDAHGVVQQLDTSIYEMHDDVIGTALGKSWPSTRLYRGGLGVVRIRYTAGYQEVPAPIRVAVLMMLGDLYKFRETSIVNGTPAAIRIPTTVDMLLQPFRLYA